MTQLFWLEVGPGSEGKISRVHKIGFRPVALQVDHLVFGLLDSRSIWQMIMNDQIYIINTWNPNDPCFG